MQYAKAQQKNVVFYMFNDEDGVSINFKTLSTHELFAEDTVFISLFNPPLEQFGGLKAEMLPTLGVVPKLDPDFSGGGIEQGNLSAKTSYHSLLSYTIRGLKKEGDY